MAVLSLFMKATLLSVEVEVAGIEGVVVKQCYPSHAVIPNNNHAYFF